MKILVVGAGAMGCLFGSLLASDNLAVTFYDIDTNKVNLLNTNGLVIKYLDRQTKYRIAAVSALSAAADFDLIIFAVKAYQTEAAAAALSDLAKKGSKVITLQNGIGHAEVLAQYFPGENIFVGITYHGAMELAPAYVHHTGVGATKISSFVPSCFGVAEQIAELFTDSGFSCEAEKNVDILCWQKLLVNSVINPVTALAHLPNGAILADEQLVQLMQHLLAEGIAVAHSMGINLDYETMWDTVVLTCKNTATNHSSMLADVLAGRPTEIMSINGSIVKIGQEHHVPVTHNLAVCEKISAF